MVSFGGQQVQMLVISTLGTSVMIGDMEMDLIISPMVTYSLVLGLEADSMDPDIRHFPMETCWMGPGRMEEDMESSSSHSPTAPDTKQSTTMDQDKEVGTKLIQFHTIQNIL